MYRDIGRAGSLGSLYRNTKLFCDRRLGAGAHWVRSRRRRGVRRACRQQAGAGRLGAGHAWGAGLGVAEGAGDRWRAAGARQRRVGCPGRAGSRRQVRGARSGRRAGGVQARGARQAGAGRTAWARGLALGCALGALGLFLARFDSVFFLSQIFGHCS